MEHEYIVEVHNLKKRYLLTPALDGVELKVKKGIILGLLGPNRIFDRPGSAKISRAGNRRFFYFQYLVPGQAQQGSHSLVVVASGIEVYDPN